MIRFLLVFALAALAHAHDGFPFAKADVAALSDREICSLYHFLRSEGGKRPWERDSAMTNREISGSLLNTFAEWSSRDMVCGIGLSGDALAHVEAHRQ